MDQELVWPRSPFANPPPASGGFELMGQLFFSFWPPVAAHSFLQEVGFVTRTFAARPNEDHARRMLGQCRCLALTWPTPCHSSTPPSSSCGRYRPFPTSKVPPIALTTCGGSREYKPVEPNGSQPPRIATRSSCRVLLSALRASVYLYFPIMDPPIHQAQEDDTITP